jgi:NADPH-dependent 2,4-dienoyl-CoA reductase/sulfur reductase-like enzyme
VLDNGEVLEADICIVGAGIIPATSFVKNGVKIERDGSIVVDSQLRAATDLFAAGDVARFPYFLHNSELIRVEHIGMAQYHGMVVAKNMAGGVHHAKSVPVFWTTQFGKSIRYCGHAMVFDQVIVDGDIGALKVVAYYVQGEKILAVASIQRDPVVVAAAELMMANRMPSITDLKARNFDLLSCVKK